MQLTIERSALLTALGRVQSVVERRNTIPILSNVQLAAEAGALDLTATDLDLAVVAQVATEIGQSGATTTPAHTLYDIVRKLPEGAQVELKLGESDGRLALRAGRSRFTLPCLPREDFPAIAEGGLPTEFSIGAPELRRLIDKTRFAISTEEMRYYLNGIYLHHAEHEGVSMLRAVATDGHRLARVDTPLPEGAAGMPGIIVPRKAVNELRKLVEDTQDPISIALSDTKIRFSLGATVLTTKLIDGTFRTTPASFPRATTRSSRRTPRSCRRPSIACRRCRPTNPRAVKLEVAPGKLTVSANSPESGSAVEELEAGYQGEPLEIGFNFRYLLDIAGQIEGDVARFTMSDAVSPTIVEDGGDTASLFILMPMRV